MRAGTTALILGAVLVFYLLGCLWRGVLALKTAFDDGSATAGALGVAVLAFGVIGTWFLWREIGFGFATERLARRLDEDETPGGGLRYEEIDDLPRSPGGRVDRTAADELFARRKAETEQSPEDWLPLVPPGGRLPRRQGLLPRPRLRHAVKLAAPAPGPAAPAEA